MGNKIEEKKKREKSIKKAFCWVLTAALTTLILFLLFVTRWRWRTRWGWRSELWNGCWKIICHNSL